MLYFPADYFDDDINRYLINILFPFRLTVQIITLPLTLREYMLNNQFTKINGPYISDHTGYIHVIIYSQIRDAYGLIPV